MDKGYIVVDGVLYRYSSDGKDEKTQMVVPTHERQRILDSCHYRVGSTLQRIARRYYFVGMRQHVAD